MSDFKEVASLLAVIAALFKGFTWVKSSVNNYILEQSSQNHAQAERHYENLENELHFLKKAHDRMEDVLKAMHAKIFETALQQDVVLKDVKTSLATVHNRLVDEIRKSKLTDLGEGVTRVSEKKD